jgi:hypothetical protein
MVQVNNKRRFKLTTMNPTIMHFYYERKKEREKERRLQVDTLNVLRRSCEIQQV